MKNLYLNILGLCVALFGMNTAIAQYSGTYTIAGTTPDFLTIQEAADSLSLYGISGPVEMDIRDGDYTGTYVQNYVPGNSMTNTVTYQSESGDSTAVWLHYVGAQPTFVCDSVQHVIFNDISFSHVSAGGGMVLYVEENIGLDVNGCAFFAFGSGAIGSDATGFDVDHISLNDCQITCMMGLNLMASNSIGSIVIEDVTSLTQSDGFNYMTDGDVQSILMDNDSIVADGNGVYVTSINGSINQTDVTNSTVTSAWDALHFNADFNNLDINLTDLDLMSFGEDGIYIRGFNGKIEDVILNNIDVDAGEYGIALYSDQLVRNIDMDDCNVTSSDNHAIYIRGYYTGVYDTDAQNIYAENYNDYRAFYIDSDKRVENVNLVSDSLYNNGDANVLDIEGELYVGYITVDLCEFVQKDSLQGGFAASFDNNDGTLEHVTITNSNFEGYSGIEMRSSAWARHIDMDNLFVFGADGYGFRMYCDDNFAHDIIATNSTFYGGGSQGFEIEMSDGDIADVHIDDCEIYSNNSTTLELDADADLNDAIIENSIITNWGGSRAFDVEANEGGLYNFTIDNCDITGAGCGNLIEIESGYQYGDSVWITNNTIVQSDPSCGGFALDLESDESDWYNVWITNNTFESYSGIELEADYGSAYQTWITDNTFELYNEGIDIDGGGIDFHVSNNSFEPHSSTTTFNYGLDINGRDGYSDDFHINNNSFTDYVSDGIEMDDIQNVEIHDNYFYASTSNNTAYHIDGDDLTEYLRIEGNQFLADDEARGIEITGSHFLTQPASIANNFISGADYSLYINDVSYVNLYNNSISTQANTDMLYLNSAYEVNVKNNIFSENSGTTTGNLFNIGTITNTEIDYNVFEFDTTVATFATGSVTAATLGQWQAMTTFGDNSFHENPMFVNEVTDLHTDCASSLLVAGTSLSDVSDDIDGNARAATPTIGADEILTASTDIWAEDSTTLCSGPIMLDAGSSSGTVTYNWSTSETTQTIMVSGPGTYTVDVTDDCGTYSDDIVVTYEPTTVASATPIGTFLTYTFTNTSSNATTYAWDFGDASPISNDVSPVHLYATDGSYTVTLIAYGPCHNDTTTFVVNPSLVGVDENGDLGTIELYPNPNNGQFNINILDVDAENVNLSVLNIAGQVIYTEELLIGSEGLQHSMDLVEFPAGMYFVSITLDGTQVAPIKMIKK